MKIRLNDQPLELAQPLSVAALLTQLERHQPGTRWRSTKPSSRAPTGPTIRCRTVTTFCCFKRSPEADVC